MLPTAPVRKLKHVSVSFVFEERTFIKNMINNYSRFHLLEGFKSNFFPPSDSKSISAITFEKVVVVVDRAKFSQLDKFLRKYKRSCIRLILAQQLK